MLVRFKSSKKLLNSTAHKDHALGVWHFDGGGIRGIVIMGWDTWPFESGNAQESQRKGSKRRMPKLPRNLNKTGDSREVTGGQTNLREGYPVRGLKVIPNKYRPYIGVPDTSTLPRMLKTTSPRIWETRLNNFSQILWLLRTMEVKKVKLFRFWTNNHLTSFKIMSAGTFLTKIYWYFQRRFFFRSAWKFFLMITSL